MSMLNLDIVIIDSGQTFRKGYPRIISRNVCD